MRAQQRRIADRISELNAVSQIKHDLEATHLDGDEGPPPKDEDDQKPHVKKEEPDVAMDDEVLKPDEPKPAILGSTKMEEVVENGAADEATSPSAKRRIAAQILVSLLLTALFSRVRTLTRPPLACTVTISTISYSGHDPRRIDRDPATRRRPGTARARSESGPDAGRREPASKDSRTAARRTRRRLGPQ